MKYGLIMALFLSVFVIGCDNKPKVQDADQVQAQQTRQSLSEANKQIGMPAIVNFQERKLAKMIFELRDQENFVCYAYLVNKMNGKVGQFLGKCLGYGLPYSVQFTNPEVVAHENDYNGGSFGTLPQADPNGLFMPDGLSATWLMLLDSKGQAHPVYVEPEIIVSPFPLHEEK